MCLQAVRISFQIVASGNENQGLPKHMRLLTQYVTLPHPHNLVTDPKYLSFRLNIFYKYFAQL